MVGLPPVVRITVKEFKQVAKCLGGWDPIFEGKHVYLIPSFLPTFTQEEASRIREHSKEIYFIQIGCIFVPVLKPGTVLPSQGIMYNLGKRWLFVPR